MSEDAYSKWVQKFLAIVSAVGSPLSVTIEANLLEVQVSTQAATIIELRAEIAALKAGAATPPPPPNPKAIPANALKWSK